MKLLSLANRLAAFVAVATLLAEGRAQTSQLVYSQNFNSAAVGTTGTGLNDGSNIKDNGGSGFTAKVYDSTSWGSLPAGQQWRALWLTSMAPGIVGNFFMPDANKGQYVSSFSANFSLLINYINRTSEPMADGFSINFGKFNNTSSAYGSEAGMYSPGNGNTGDVLTLSWYTYTGGTPRIEARYNGATIATSAQAPFWNSSSPAPNTAFLPVNFSWGTNGLNLTYNGISIFSNLSVPGFTPGVGYSFAMAARTGSAYENLFVDNIAINTTVAPFVWSGGSGNWTTAGSWTIGTAPTTDNNWIVMAGAGGNASNNAVNAMQGLVFATNATGSYVLSGNAFTNGAAGITNNSSNAQTIASGVTLGAAQTFNAANGALVFNGAINASNNALSIQGTNAVTINGAISGTGATLTKSDAGTLTLSGTNTYSGGTLVSAGRLVGSSMSLQGAITNNASVEFSQTNSGTYAGNMSGTGSLVKSGAGTTTLTGNNTYSGATTISAGTLAVSTNAAVGSSSGISMANATTFAYTGGAATIDRNISVTGGTGTLRNSGGGTLTLSGTLSKNGTVLKFGQGSFNVTGTITGASANSDLLVDNATVTLSASNTYNGPTYIRNAGVLNANVAGALPTGTRSALILDDTGTGGSTLSLGASQQIASLTGADSSSVALGSNALTIGTTSGSTVYAGSISGTGSLVKDGNSTQVLSGSNSFSGPLTISAGTLQVGNGTDAGSIASVSAITNNGALVYNVGAGQRTLGATIIGTGSLTQQSAGGTLNITGNNTYSGGTTITAGQVHVSQTNGLGTGSVTLTGSAANPAKLSFLTESSTLYMGALTLNGYATLDLLPNATMQSSGAVTLNSTDNFINIAGNTWNTGTNILVTGTSLSFGSGASILLTGSTLNNTNVALGGSLAVGRTTFTFNSNSSSLYLVATGTHYDVLWTGAQNGQWNTSATNWQQTTMGTNPTGPNIAFVNDDDVYFGAAAAAGGPITVEAGGVHTGGMYVTNASGTVTLQGGKITVDDLTKTGAGALTIKSDLAAIDADNDYNEFFLNQGSGAVRVEGQFSGQARLLQAGAGTMTLAASNSYTGETVVSAGTLALGANSALGTGALTVSGGTLDTGTYNQTLTNVVTLASGAITGSGSLTATGYAVQDGSISANLGGVGGLTKTTAGTVTLSGNNTYIGLTHVDGGTLQVSADANLGDASNALHLENGTLKTTADLNSSRAMTMTRNGTIDTDGHAVALAGAIDGGGSLTKNGAGTLTLSGANTYSGGTTVSAGRLAGTTTSLQGTINNNAEVEFAQETSGTYDNVISGNGSLVKSGAGKVTMTGTSTYMGTTRIAGGGLIVNGSIADSAVTVQSGGFLGGSGTVGSVTVEMGGTVAPGNSPGTLNINGDINWLGGGSYNWQIVAATGVAGTDWDLINATGTLDLSTLSVGSQFSINLWSLASTGPDASGALGDFNANQNYTWTLVTASNGMTGFSADKFAINLLATNGTEGFANALGGGTFSISQSGNDLNLIFTAAGGQPVPEPGTWAAAALLVGAAGYVRWRKRAKLS